MRYVFKLAIDAKLEDPEAVPNNEEIYDTISYAISADFGIEEAVRDALRSWGLKIGDIEIEDA